MYDYVEAMKKDIREAIDEEYNLRDYRGRRNDLEETLNDELWASSITGNDGSASYTFDRLQAKEYVMDNIELVAEMVNEFSIDSQTVATKFLQSDWEYFDVSLRCYMLGEAICRALDELEAEHVFDTTDIDYDRSTRKKEITMEY